MYLVRTLWMMACCDPGCTWAKGRAGGLILNRLDRSTGSRVFSVSARCCSCCGQGWHWIISRGWGLITLVLKVNPQPISNLIRATLPLLTSLRRSELPLLVYNAFIYLFVFVLELPQAHPWLGWEFCTQLRNTGVIFSVSSLSSSLVTQIWFPLSCQSKR